MGTVFVLGITHVVVLAILLYGAYRWVQGSKDDRNADDARLESRLRIMVCCIGFAMLALIGYLFWGPWMHFFSAR